MKYKIIHDKDECIGCGSCEIESDNWKMEGDKAKPLKIILDNKKEVKSNEKAAESCPTKCIKIIKEK